MDLESLVHRPEPARNGLRLGSVPFLYAEPLLSGLREREGVTLFRAQSDSLAREFASGDCDAALLPVLGAVRKFRARIVPGMGVCAAGAAGSERLLCRVPPAEVKTVSVSAGDTFSGELALILLAEVFSARPQLVEDTADADARVLAGYAGMAPVDGLALELDLGTLWYDLTGLPLVLSVWALGDRAPAAQLRTLLVQSLQSGLDNLESIVEEGAVARGLDIDVAREYLCQCLHYRAGGEEMDSMRTLLALARKHGLCPPDTPLMFC